MKGKINELRAKIDGIDEKVLKLIEDRLKIVKEIGGIKAGEGVAMYDPLREAEMIKALSKKTSLEDSFVMKIYRDIIAYCRGDEKKVERDDKSQVVAEKMAGRKVAVLGPPGTFTEQASKRVFTESELTFCEGVGEVFRLVEAGDVEYGVVAMENSLEGSVGKTMEALIEFDVFIIGELTLDINLCLMKDAATEDIKVILSHPHALAQCAEYLKENYPEAKLVSAKSTAAAMKELGDYGDAAAIGFAEAGKTYGLQVIAENIQDDYSQTRFVVISRIEKFGGKTSLIFALKDEAGALYSILQAFAGKDINLTKIESRPSKRKLGEYLFFMDFENSGLGESEVGEVVESVKTKTTFLKVLGSY